MNGGIMKKIQIFITILALFSGGYAGADNIILAPAPNQANALMAERDALKSQLEGLQSENVRCKKQQTGWTVATIIGGIGVVGTTAGAIYQGLDWKKKNEELSKQKSELEKTNATIGAE